MGHVGLEPTTYGLKVRYSTIELMTLLSAGQYTIVYRSVKSKTLVVGEGLEPPKLITPDLQSGPFAALETHQQRRRESNPHLRFWRPSFYR